MTAKSECQCCYGSGRVIRDPDIGTDQECFVCEGLGIILEEEYKLTSKPSNQRLMFECVGCGYLHHEKVSSCDCMENPNAVYNEWVATLVKQENA